MINLICLYGVDPALALESYLKLSNSEQISILGALQKESKFNPNSDANDLFVTIKNYANNTL